MLCRVTKIIIFESNYEMKKSKARKGEEDKRELCQRISKFHSYLREMKTKYAPKSVEDSDWSPLFKLAVDDFETVDYYYELFILESTEEEQKKIYEELKKEIEMTDGIFKFEENFDGYFKGDHVYWSSVTGFKYLDNTDQIKVLQLLNPSIKVLPTSKGAPWSSRASQINGTNYGKR